MRTLTCAMALAMGLGLTFGAGQAAQAAGCAMPGNAQAMVAEAGAQMNAQRRAKGRRALGRDAALDAAAQAHACWMARTGNFSHRGASGTGPKARVKSRGYCTRLVAENIALGQGSGARVVGDWMGSSGHRKNILLPGVGEYGVGLSIVQGKPAWVMVFANPC